MENSDSLRDQAIERFWETIPPLWGMVRRQIRSTAAARFGLTFEQFYILRHIRKGSTSVSELAAVKRISRPAISQAVDTLVNKELLTRVQSMQHLTGQDLAEVINAFEILNAIVEKPAGCLR